MKPDPKYPSLYQVNTRVWLTKLTTSAGHRATLDDIPDNELDRIAGLGFDWIWLLSVWCTGEIGRTISCNNPVWQSDFKTTLPDLKKEDIGGSGFAIAGYHVDQELGGNEALQKLRTRMNIRGLKLMLDFVPNHMGPDHSWVEEYPEYFISGTEQNINQYPQNFTRLNINGKEIILAHGKDPYFDGWPDTYQLDYSNPATVKAMSAELLRISKLCDGLRCDMAMLILPDVFESTWGKKALPFWQENIKAVRSQNNRFCFLAEAYWNMEWEMLQLGFDFAYDKRLYDRLHEGNAKIVREHLAAPTDYQNKLARFLENHDEKRAAAVFEPSKHKTAAIITFLSPGLRFFHEGQLNGFLKHISPHLVRAPKEFTDTGISEFYEGLLNILKESVIRNGCWKLLNCRPAWMGNYTWDSFIAYSWEDKGIVRVLITVNFAPYQGQCFVQLPDSKLKKKTVRFEDAMNPIVYERNGSELMEKGLFLDMDPWGYHVFFIT